MSELRYRAVPHDSLAPGECVIEPHTAEFGAWMLWFCFTRTIDGKPERRWVPVIPNGDAPAERAGWGLRRVVASRWQVSPSIRCLESRGHDGKDVVEVWHETPAIVDVPEGLAWQG